MFVHVSIYVQWTLGPLYYTYTIFYMYCTHFAYAAYVQATSFCIIYGSTYKRIDSLF